MLTSLPLSQLAGQYACLADLRTDFNQIYVNAKRYNAPGSGIFLDAKKQHVRRLVPSASSFVHLLRN